MCGIAGIWGKGDIRNVTRALKHRGPDGEGYFECERLKLGVTRLKVIDLLTGDQPIFNEDKSIVTVFNGEIYNYKSIRETLKKHGHLFKTQTDTEIIVHSYEEWGIDCLNYFNGMFSLAIFDKNKRRLFIARDRLGIKPLYWCFKNNRLIFASEIKAILKEFSTHPDIDEDFFCFEAPLLKKTMFRDIYNLLPGHYISFDGKELIEKTYWAIEPSNGRYDMTEDEAKEELKFLLNDSIKLRLQSDVPVGTFVSGGLDSSIIAKIGGCKNLFSCNYDLDDKYDEYKYSRLIADELETPLSLVLPKPEDLEDKLSLILYHLDHPIGTASSISEFMIAEAAAKSVKVTLGGQGADELFGGYARHLIFTNKKPYKIDWLKKYYSPLLAFFESIKNVDNPAISYYNLIKRGPYSKSHLKLVDKCFDSSQSIINGMLLCDITFLLPSLLQMNDRASSCFGMENRVPFLDHRIVEFAFKIPDNFKIKGEISKYILRKAVEGSIPEIIRTRKDKKGLVTPINIWLNNDLKKWKTHVFACLENRGIKVPSSSLRGEFDRSAYNYICLELWLQRFFPDFEF